MTSPVTTSVEDRATHTGTVFDIGYQRYEGTREGRGRARLAMIKDGVRAVLGLGRGGRAKILPWFFIGVLAAIALVMALVIGAAVRYGGVEEAAQANLPTHSDYYGIASVIIFVFAAVVGPELLCRDRRDGVIYLYLVRPLTGTDYIVSRWVAGLLIMTVASWIPQFILFFGLTMGQPAPLEYLQKQWTDVPKFLLSGFSIAIYATTLALLTASFTSRRAYASVFMVGLFIVTAPFTIGLAQEISGPVGQWISMFNLAHIPVHVNDVIFGQPSEITKEAPARELGGTVLVTWFLAWTLVPAVFLWSRYRRLTP